MQTQQPNPPIDLPAQAWRHLIHTLFVLLPPPIEDTPEATLARNHAAVARIAALAPVNANEAELAAQCIAARAQAEDILRLIRLHAADITLVLKLNAQYTSMIRAALAAHGRLLREQQQRRKRETTHDAADQDEWTRHVAAEAMLSAMPEAPKPSVVAKIVTKSHTSETETPKRQSPSEPNTVARIEAMIDAAIRSADPNWKRHGLPRSNKDIQHMPQQRSA